MNPIRDALQALGIRRLALAVHDAALPGDPADDTGRGAPLSRGGLGFLRFAAALGFDALQLGPQGKTTAHDASPYDATLFARSELSIALEPLRAAGLLSEEAFEKAIAARPAGALERAAHRQVFETQRAALDDAYARAPREPPLAFAEANREWLQPHFLYAALGMEHGSGDWLLWPEHDRHLLNPSSDPARGQALAARHEELLARLSFEQWLAHAQHDAFRAEARRAGLRLFGDLQIGFSHEDVWAYQSLLLKPFRMGAPPSRTNPEGQPWNYAVLDPRLVRGSEDTRRGERHSEEGAGAPDSARKGPALLFVERRVGKLLAEFDGLRIDHPHGLIDPWVYEGARRDALRAVQHGSRLFSSPDRAEFAAFAIAQPAQLDKKLARHADAWVRDLTDAQVDRYAVLFDAIVAAARANGRETFDLVCEVLSTQPYPVQRVLERHGLGRFRVTQKAGLADPRDVYRSENAKPQDWIMVGNHDTEPIWRVAERWCATSVALDHARYLADRLGCDARWAETTAKDPALLATAKLAELFVGPASNVMVHFTDLLGLREAYNRPGTVNAQNWSLRVPPDYALEYPAAAAAGRALHLPRALATALRARGGQSDLVKALEEI